MEKEITATILEKSVFCVINPALTFIIITVMAQEIKQATCLSICKISMCLN